MSENNKDVFDKIMLLPGLRIFNRFYTKNKSILMYLFFGALTTLVSVVTFALFNSCFSLHELIANLISWIFAVSFAYATNRKWVFCSTTKNIEFLKEVIAFFSGRVLTLVIEEIIIFICITLLNLNSLAVKITAQFAVLVANYIISKLFIFKNN